MTTIIYDLQSYTDLKALAADQCSGNKHVGYKATPTDRLGGEFYWNGSSLTTEVAADPSEINYVVPTCKAANGSQGAFVRYLLPSDAIRAVESTADIPPLSAQYYGIFAASAGTLGDDQEGLFVWDDTDLSSQVTADTESTHFIAPASDDTGASGAYVRTGPKGVYYLEKFSSATDETPWERAAALMDAGETLIVPHNMTYTFSSGVVFTQNQIHIKSLGETITQPLIKAGTAGLTLLNLQGNACRVSRLNFEGTATDVTNHETAYSTVVALDFSRGGNSEAYANLDDDVDYCYFGNVGTAVTGAGRNVSINRSIFYECQYGIAPTVYVYDTTKKSDTRGWRIINNWFQKMGNPYISMESSAETACILVPIDEAIADGKGDYACATHVAENNYVDSCAHFWIGTLNTCRIANNQCFNMSGPLVTCLPGTGVYINGYGYGRFGHITGNTWYGVAEHDTESVRNAEYFINVEKTFYLKISNNVASMCSKSLLRVVNNGALNVSSETYYGANYSYTRVGDFAAITVQPLDTGDSDKYNHISNCMILPDPTYKYERGIKCTTNSSMLTVDGGFIAAGRDTSTPHVDPAQVNRWHFSDDSDIKAYGKITANKLVVSGQLGTTGIAEASGYSYTIQHSDLQAAENLVAKDIVYLNTSAKWAKAKADDMATCGYLGMVMVGANTNYYPTVIHRGPVIHSGFTGSINPGRPIWLSDATAGTVTGTVPGTSGHVVQFIGYIATDQNGVIMDPGPPVEIP